MCGLVALIGDPDKKMLDVFKTMVNIDVIRGPDSTGIAAVRKEGVFYMKDTLLPPHLMDDKDFRAEFEGKKYLNYAYIGHNRKATVGHITPDNAHPFQHEHITLVHNGTLRAHIDAGQKERFGTDSESIAYSMAKDGVRPTWRKLNGDASLIWYDARSDRLGTITNARRPLLFAWSKDHKHVVIGSESWMITSACAREKLELATNEEGKPAVFIPKPHHMHQFYWDNTKRIVTVSVKKLKHYDPPPVSRQAQGAKPWEDEWDWWERDQNLGAAYGNGQTGQNSHGGNGEHRHVFKLSDFRKEREEKERRRNETEEEWSARESAKLAKVLGERLAAQKEEEQQLIDNFKATGTATDYGIPEKEFHETYDSCTFCNESLATEFDTAVILDDRRAVCESCVMSAELNNLDYTQMRCF